MCKKKKEDIGKRLSDTVAPDSFILAKTLEERSTFWD